MGRVREALRLQRILSGTPPRDKRRKIVAVSDFDSIAALNCAITNDDNPKTIRALQQKTFKKRFDDISTGEITTYAALTQYSMQSIQKLYHHSL